MWAGIATRRRRRLGTAGFPVRRESDRGLGASLSPDSIPNLALANVPRLMALAEAISEKATNFLSPL